MPRLFIGVWPPEHVIEELRALRRKDQRGVRFLDPHTWHVTLRVLGDCAIDDVIAALDGLDLPVATARLGPGVDLLGGRSLVIPVTGVEDLAAAVARRTSTIGESPRRRFHGHLTIARLKSGAVPPPAVGSFVETAFTVDEIALISGRLHSEGARYTTEATWPLASGIDDD